MSELIRHLVWFFLIASAVAYAIFLTAGSFITAQAIDATHIVQARDELAPGEHRLSGIVMVPTTCTELSVRTEKLSDTEYNLAFTTWEEPSVNCKVDDTPRAFHAILFAPAAGIHIIGTIDGAPLTIVAIPVYRGKTI